MVVLREAEPEDAAEMARIQSESLRSEATDHYTDEQLAHLAPPEPSADSIPDAEFADDARRAVVAARNDDVVGWGSVHLDDGLLAATFVDPDHVGHGVGRAIVERLEAVARDAGVATLTVPASRGAVGFYESLGYERRREIDASGPDAPPIGGYEMSKELP